MTRLVERGNVIPSGFQALDTHVSDVDEYINVRDLRVLNNNHNILLARGIRRGLFTMNDPYNENIPSGGLAGGTGYFLASSVYPPTDVGSTVACAAPVWISPYTQQLTIVGYGQRRGSVDTYLLPSLLVAGAPATQPDIANGLLFGAANSLHAVAIPLPTGIQSTWQFGVLYMYVGGGIDTVQTESGTVIGAYHSPTGCYVDTEDFEPPVGLNRYGISAAYVTANADSPRMITRVEVVTYGGSSYPRFHFDRAFSIMPVPGTDTLTFCTAKGVKCMSIAAGETFVSDFGDRGDPLM